MNNSSEPGAAARDYWNPYVAGVALGLVLLASYLVLGFGIGASGAASRFGAYVTASLAPEHAGTSAYFSAYFSEGASPLNSWIVFGVLGIFLGGVVGSVTAGRQKKEITRGPRISAGLRMTLALTGGVIMGFAARLSRGCTSGQALSGGALMSAGSWIFMLSVFAGGYALAYFLRRQWT
ncbi:MAG: YeeE/YedE thiosulfate transporter family protein [Pseudomonadota bacterium]